MNKPLPVFWECRRFVRLAGLMAGIAMAVFSRAAAQEVFTTPTQYPIARYAKMLDKSPFAQATALQAAAPPKENFTKDLVLISHYRVGGVLYANLLNRATQRRIVVTSAADPAVEIKAVALVANSNPWQVKLVARFHDEEGTVAHDVPTFALQPAIQKNATADAGISANPVPRVQFRRKEDND